MVLHVTLYYMLNGSICYMVLNVTWYYMFRVTTCYMVLLNFVCGIAEHEIQLGTTN